MRWPPAQHTAAVQRSTQDVALCCTCGAPVLAQGGAVGSSARAPHRVRGPCGCLFSGSRVEFCFRLQQGHEHSQVKRPGADQEDTGRVCGRMGQYKWLEGSHEGGPGYEGVVLLHSSVGPMNSLCSNCSGGELGRFGEECRAAVWWWAP